MHLTARPISPLRAPLILGPLLFLLLLAMPGGTRAFAEEKTAAASGETARQEVAGQGQTLKIYCDLFSENPLNIVVAADLAEFSVDLPTDNEKEFQTISTQSVWEGSTLKVTISIQRQKYYQVTKDAWESRNIGIQQFPVSLKLGETVEPLEINGKVLRVSLVADGKPKDR